MRINLVARWSILPAVLLVAGFVLGLAIQPSVARNGAMKDFKVETQLRLPGPGDLTVTRLVDPDTGVTCYAIISSDMALSCVKK